MDATAAGSPNDDAAARSPLVQASKKALAWSCGVASAVGRVVTTEVVTATVVDVEVGTDDVVVGADRVVTVFKAGWLEPPEHPAAAAATPTAAAAATTSLRGRAMTGTGPSGRVSCPVPPARGR